MCSRHSICLPGFLLRLYFSYRIISASWIWFLNFTEIPFPRRPHFIRYIYIYKCIHTNAHVYISFHLEETYDVCEKCTQPLESNIKCIMYTRSSVFRTPARRAPEHTVVIRFGILAYINIYFYMYFSLFFLFVRIPGWNLLRP